jgi:hypothetical protein
MGEEKCREEKGRGQGWKNRRMMKHDSPP